MWLHLPNTILKYKNALRFRNLYSEIGRHFIDNFTYSTVLPFIFITKRTISMSTIPKGSAIHAD